MPVSKPDNIHPRLPKALRPLLNDPRVEEISDERGLGFGPQGDGYWVYLKPGWINTNLGAHMVHEWNVKDVLAEMRDYIEPCHCAACGGPEEEK